MKLSPNNFVLTPSFHRMESIGGKNRKSSDLQKDGC